MEDRADQADGFRSLVRRWFVHVIDHQDVDHSFLRFELETELVLDRGEDADVFGLGIVVDRPLRCGLDEEVV